MMEEEGALPSTTHKVPLLQQIAASSKPVLALAPMIDQSELAYRMLMRELVAGNRNTIKDEQLNDDGTPLLICYTPMFWAEFFATDENYRNTHFFSCPYDRPLVVQFAGNDPELLVKAAKYVEDHCDAVDINLGCPQSVARAKKVGAWMCDNQALVSRCVSALAQNIKVPTFCKMRVQHKVEDTIKFALMLQDSGCQLLAVHGRTREQDRQGTASWEQIKSVKQALRIPVIANGNIYHWSDIDKCFEATGADGVMSAEPSLIDPLNIFGEYSNQRQKRRRIENSTLTTTTDNNTTNDNTTNDNNTTNNNNKSDGSADFRHTQLPVAMLFMEYVERYPQESNAKRVREHLFHLLGYRQRSYQLFKKKGEDYLRQYMWLNKQVDIRQQMYEAQTIEGLAEAVKALSRRVIEGTPIEGTRKRKRQPDNKGDKEKEKEKESKIDKEEKDTAKEKEKEENDVKG